MASAPPPRASSPTTARAQREELIEMLKKAYWMEIETVMSYIANSINPDGVRAQEIIESLQEDVQEELGHAQQFADRIKELYGVVPGSLDFTRRADLPAAARAPDRHRPRHQGRDRGRDRRDRALQPHHRVHRRRRPGDAGHGDRDPARRGGPPPAVRGLPARVRGRGPRVATGAGNRLRRVRDRVSVRCERVGDRWSDALLDATAGRRCRARRARQRRGCSFANRAAPG